ncbi:MAG TPA: serine/threonine-protein kinase [Pseudonocardiaceae bacterium]|nr:serine/threonine-protein kinase [Pseudonocardiaceae bacterium]
MSDEGELIVGRYRLVSRLGSGAMGVVWQAHDERLRRTVAIKQLLLPPRLSESEADEANRRAMREGRITARLHHPHAIAVYDVVEHQGQPCLIMEYLASRSLATVLATQGVLPPEEVASIGSQIASALAAAHKAGIVHRDIKPGNVLLADDGTVKITDFGISHAVGDVTVTATGMLAGTPAYLAPEVARGITAGFSSDVFSLGATLYTALEGTPPFGLNSNPIALLHQVASGEITPPRQSDPLTPVLLRLLQPDPDQRPTMDQAHEALATLAASPAGPAGGPSAPAPSPPRPDRPFEPVPRTQQTLLQVAPLEETISLATSTGLRTAADRAPAGGNGWPGRRNLLAGVLTVVVLAAGVMVTVLISHGNVTGGNAATNTSGGMGQSLQTLPAQPAPASTTQETPTSPSDGLTQSVPAPPGPSSTTEIAPTTLPVPGSSQDTPEQLQGAITSYYALVPGNLPAAWNRLTTNYQQSHAGGFTGYQNFWSPVQRVTVVDVSAKQGDTVDATIDYFFNDGKVIEEQTSYGLVTEDGLWKIDSSTVHSSRTK